jgi:hypothetical protein
MAGDLRDDRGFLRRWSQRKSAAARRPTSPTPQAPAASAPTAATGGPSTDRAVAAGTLPAQQPDPVRGTPRDPAAELPPVESLGFDSDFTRYLAPKVEESLKRRALRKLFSDPRFNVMDGLDVYIDDYSKSEPIPANLVGELRHARYIFDPPKTRLNPAGHVEDVPEEAQAVATPSPSDSTLAGETRRDGDAPAPDSARPAGEADGAASEAAGAPDAADEVADDASERLDVPAVGVAPVAAGAQGKR